MVKPTDQQHLQPISLAELGSNSPNIGPKKAEFPNWLIRSLAWAFIIGLVAWMGTLNAAVQEEERNQSALEIALTAEREASNVNFIYIRESLARIENKIDRKVTRGN